jgi:hypothetical protein
MLTMSELLFVIATITCPFTFTTESEQLTESRPALPAEPIANEYDTGRIRTSTVSLLQLHSISAKETMITAEQGEKRWGFFISYS